MNECVVRKCKCQHEWQDQKYGLGMRVFNPGLKDLKCTVCGNKVAKPDKK